MTVSWLLIIAYALIAAASVVILIESVGYEDDE